MAKLQQCFFGVKKVHILNSQHKHKRWLLDLFIIKYSMICKRKREPNFHVFSPMHISRSHAHVIMKVHCIKENNQLILTKKSLMHQSQLVKMIESLKSSQNNRSETTECYWSDQKVVSNRPVDHHQFQTLMQMTLPYPLQCLNSVFEL